MVDVPVAVKVTTPSGTGTSVASTGATGKSGAGPMPVAKASSVFVPGPMTQELTCAMPFAPVTTVAGVTLPPPDVMRKWIVAPATALLLPSVTSTAGGVSTGWFAVPVWFSVPSTGAILEGSPQVTSLKQHVRPPTPKCTIAANAGRGVTRAAKRLKALRQADPVRAANRVASQGRNPAEAFARA